MRKGTYVGADGERDTGGHLQFELGGVEGDELAFAGFVGRCGGVVGEVLGDLEGRHGGDASVAHGAHGFRRE